MYIENNAKAPAAGDAAVLGAALTGKTDKMTEAAIDNIGVFSAQNESDKTVLHMLINNDKMSPNEMYNQVVAAVEGGAPVDIPDKDGVRPIHLAAKQQNLRLVEYLLSKNVEPSSITSTNQTALHYAVIPKTISCEPGAKEEREKRDRITEPSKVQIKKVTDNLQDDVQNAMRDPVLSKYIRHLGNLATEGHLIPKDKTDDQTVASIFEDTVSSVKSGTTKEEAIQIMKSQMKVLVKEVYQRSLDKFNNGLEPAEFKQDDDNAWGPEDVPSNIQRESNRVLYNIKSMKVWYADLESSANKTMDEALGKLLARTNSMNENTFLISEELDKIKNIFHMFKTMIEFESRDTGDEPLTHNILPLGAPQTHQQILTTSDNLKDRFNRTVINQGGGPQLRLDNLFNEITDSIKINAPETELRTDPVNPRNAYNVFRMSLTDPNVEDLNNVHDPHQNIVDYLDTPRGANNERTVSDMTRYYINEYDDYVDQIRQLTQQIKDNYKRVNPNQILQRVAHIQTRLSIMIYGIYLLSVMFNLIDIIKEKLEDMYSDRESRQMHEDFVNRIKSVLNSSEIERQIKTKGGANVSKLYMGDSNGNIIEDKDHILLKRSGSGHVDRNAAPAGAPPNWTSNQQSMDYYVLYNKVTKETNLVHLEYVYDDPVAAGMGYAVTNYYDRMADNEVNHNQYQDGKLYYITRGTRPDDPTGTPNQPMEYVVNIVDTPKVFDGDVDEIIQKARDSLEKQLKITYNLITGGQKELTAVINAYNQIQGLKVMKAYHNDMNDDLALMSATSSDYNSLLSAPLPDNPELPPKMEDVQSLIDAQVRENITDNINGNRNTPGYEKIHPVDLPNVYRRFIDRYFYRLSDDREIKIISDLAGVAETAFTPGIVPNVGGGVPAGRLGTEQQNTDKITTIYPILQEVMSHHLEALKYLSIMWFMTQFHHQIKDPRPLTNDPNAFDGINLNVANPTNYTDYVKFVASIDNTRPEQITLMTIGKLIDQIMISTLKNVLVSATNLYLYKLAYPQNPPTVQQNVLTRAILGGRGVDFAFDESLIEMEDEIGREIGELEMAQFLGRYGNPTELQLLSSSYRKFKKSPAEQIRRKISYESLKDVDDLCYGMDEDVVIALINGGTDINKVDAAGKSPLDYAVELQNVELVSYLVERNAVVDPSLYNVAYDRLVRAIQASPMFNITEIENRVASHMVEKSGKTVIPAKSIAILRMTMYLFDHQLTLIANRFPNLYSADDHQKVIEMAGIKEYDNFTLPITKVEDSLIKDTALGNTTLRESLEQIRSRINNLHSDILSLTNQIANMRMQMERYDATDPRRAEMQNVVDDLEQTAGGITTEIDDLERRKGDIERRMNNPRLDARLKPVINRIKGYQIDYTEVTNSRMFNVTHAYDKFFRDGLNNARVDESTMEYVTYFQMWESYLSTLNEAHEAQLNPDPTQLTRAVQAHLLKVRDQVGQTPEFLESIKPITELYQKVWAKYASDYFDMSMYLSDTYENYAMNQIFNIMVHVFKHTISVDVVNATAGLMAKTVSAGDNARFRIAVTNILEDMSESGFIRECMTNLPRKVIKNVCVMSEGENDKDLGMGVSDILNSTLDMLSFSRYRGFDQSKIKLAKDNIVEYYSEYAKTYTAEMHSVMVKQLKSLMYQNKQLNILRELAKAGR